MLFKYIWKYKWRYLFGLISLFAVDILSLFIPEFTGDITDGLESGGFTFEDVLPLMIGILLAGAGMALGRLAWRYFLFGGSRKIERDLRNDIFTHLTKLSMPFFNEHKTGDLMAHFTNDLNAIRMAIGPAVITTFDAVIMTVMVLVRMVQHVDVRLMGMACIPMVIIMIGAILYGRSMEKRFAEKQEAFSELSDQVQESISGVRVIKAFVQEQKELQAFARLNKKNMDKNMRVVKLNAVVMPLLDFCIGVSCVITLLYGGWLVLEQEITLGQFVAFNQYIGMLVWPMIAAGDSINFFSQGMASVHRIKEILSVKPEVYDEACDKGIEKLEGSISINDLSFKYAPSLPDVLSDISVDIPQGSTLAIIGRTGSGKTTFANLLVRMSNVPEGMITIDGHDIREIPLATLREQIAYVPQDNFLFSDTIQTNIAFGTRRQMELPEEKEKIKIVKLRKDRLEDYLDNTLSLRTSRADAAYNDLAQVQESAKQACIHDNIMEFPKKYSTMVGERGVTVSGGQKQRSSIARALMKDAPVLILDDALSAVDTGTEEMIIENLKELRKDKTTIIIAHRISTIQHADKILVLEEGRKIEYGSHSELLKAGGSYRKLYEKQQLEKMLEGA